MIKLLFLFFHIFGSGFSPLADCTDAKATWYDYQCAFENNGACGYEDRLGPKGPGYLYGFAANPGLFENSNACGVCYEIVGPMGAVRGKVIDRCPECSVDLNHIDLTEETFTKVQNKSVGITAISIREVACDVTGNIKVIVKDGSSIYWSAFLFTNHKTKLKNLQVKINDNWVDFPRSTYGYFEVNQQHEYPLTIRLVDKYDQSVEGTVNSPSGSYDMDGQFPTPTSFTPSRDCCAPPDIYSVIYDDQLGTYWQVWSGEETADLAESTVVHGGTKAIKTELAGWGGFQVGTTNKAALVDFSKLTFWVRSDAPIKLFVKGASTDNGTGVYRDIVAGEQWQEVDVDLVDLSKGGFFAGVYIQNFQNSAHVLYIDEIKLTTSGRDNTVCVETGLDGNNEVKKCSDDSDAAVRNSVKILFIMIVIALLV